MKIKMIIGNKEFTVNLYNNTTTQSFIKMLPLTLDMSDYAHEKYYYLPQKLPTAEYLAKIIQEGDLMLYGDNCLLIF